MSTHIPAPLASNYDLTDAAELQLFVLLLDFSQNGPDCLNRYSADCLRAVAKRLEEDIDPMHDGLLSAIESRIAYQPIYAGLSWRQYIIACNVAAHMIRFGADIHLTSGDLGITHGPVNASAPTHNAITHGRCSVCGHYGSDCTGVATKWGIDLTGYGPLTADERKINAAMVRWADWTPDGDTGAEHGPLTALDYLISTGTVDRTLHASPLDSSRERWGNGAWDVALHIPGCWQHMTLTKVAQFAANVAQGL
jgi:hypothetical protein